MFVTPPSDEMVRSAGITGVAATENFADLLDALSGVDLSDTSMFGLMKQLKAAGVPSVIVTATKPNPTNCHVIATELRHLGPDGRVTSATLPVR